MRKENVNVKETENKDVTPLLDGELESAAGGTDSYLASRWECLECGARGCWCGVNSYIDMEMDLHTHMTGHKNFRINSRSFDRPCDPYED